MYAKSTWAMGWTVVLFVSAFSLPVQAAPGDLDQDGDVDGADYVLFRGCIAGPQTPVVNASCANAHFDADSDVDLVDIGGFQDAFTSSCAAPHTNDECQCPMPVSDGTRQYTNIGSTTDGPSEPTMCSFFGNSQVASDVWYCYRATCTGTAFFGLCGSGYDTKLAVYGGCGCPSAPPLACSDDDCGRNLANVQSRVEIPVTAGQRYMVRVGGYAGTQGNGQLTIGCNFDSCATGTGDCFEPSPPGVPGCGDPVCCRETCELDRFCCDVEWDENCAAEAEGVCTGSFPACAPGSGFCGEGHANPGCDNIDCCNTICFNDPYCCLETWDGTCAADARSACFLACTPTAGDCFIERTEGAGCNIESCCRTVCTADSYCCDVVWDDVCVDMANELCN